MRLLIDEMFDPAIAVALRTKAYDAIAVAADSTLRSLDDRKVFEVAQTGGRAVLTENVKDFKPLVDEYQAAGWPHYGIIFTSNKAFPRANLGTVGALVVALSVLFEEWPDNDRSSREHWLRPPSTV